MAILAIGGILATATAVGAATGHHELQSATLSIKTKAIAHGKHHSDTVSARGPSTS